MRKIKKLARIENKKDRLNKKDERYFQKYGFHLEKKEKKKKTSLEHIKLFLPYLKNYKFQLVLVCIIIIGLSAISIYWPTFLTLMIDFTVAGDYDQALYYGIAYFGIEASLGLFYIALNSLTYKVFSKVAHEIRLDLVTELSNTQTSKFNTVSSGEILSRINTDPEKFTYEINQTLQRIPAFIRQFGRLILAFVYSWILGTVFFIGGIIILIASQVTSKRFIAPAEKISSKVTDEYIAQSSEMVRGIRDIKNLNIFTHFQRKFKVTSQHKANADFNKEQKNVLNIEIFEMIVACTELLAFVFTLSLIIQGNISLGVFTFAMFYSYNILNSFVILSYINTSLHKMDVCATRMQELRDENIYPKEHFGTKTLVNPKGRLQFKDVYFSYGDSPVFENLNFDIKPGECIGIVGKSGEGKSTILNLIPKIYDIDSGQILIDDIDIKKLSKDSLRNVVSVVPQAPYIFNLSIKENLRLVKENATEEDLRTACRKANILDFILSTPKGFDTIVGEGGVILSGGQKQRLAIARAFLKHSKILLLDEATSALDNQSQNEIKKTIANMQKSCTIIVVAHRLSTVSDCDRIFVLDNHKLVAIGTHNELMKTCEIYKNLYQQENV